MWSTIDKILQHTITRSCVILSAFIFLNIGCTHIKETYRNPMMYNNRLVETEFYPHVITFQQLCRAEVKVNIKFGDLPDGDIGRCKYLPDFSFLDSIIIDRKSWDRLKHWEREQLLFHELGHCVLGRPHEDAMIIGPLEKEMPASIMHSSKMIPEYRLFQEYYINELCSL